MDNVRGDIAKLSASMKALNAAMAKGYPEFDENQPRGPDGRWGGGEGNQARTPGGKKPKGRTGKKPSAETVRRNVRSKEFQAKAKKAEEAARRAKEAVERLAREIEARKPPPPDRWKDLDDIVKNTHDRIYGLDDDVWKEPTFADAMFNFATSLSVIVPALLMNSVGISAPMMLNAALFTTTGIYRMIRHVYRKLTITGYRGVKPDYMDD